MKGDIQTAPFAVTTVLVFLAITMLIFGFVSTHNTFTAEVLVPNLQKQALADSTHLFGNCIKEGGIITEESIESKAYPCTEKLKLNFVRLTNIETGKEWIYGDEAKGLHQYKLFTAMKSGENVEGLIVYGKA